MYFLRYIALSACIALASCAWKQTTTSEPSDYVEVKNPAVSLSPDAPATIWVPRSYVEKGVPRGGDVLKMGAEKVVQGIRGDSQQPQQGVAEQEATASAQYEASRQAAAPGGYTPPAPAGRQAAYPAAPPPYQERMPTAVQTFTGVKNRIAILETGRSEMVQPLYEELRRASVGGILDPGQSAFLAQSANLTTDADKAVFAIRLQQEYGVNVAIFLSAPDGVTSGKDISAEIYDALAGGMLQKYDGTITKDPVEDRSYRTIAQLPVSFTEKIRDYLALIPWYGRITVVEGNRAYVAAGRESGLRVGQLLKIYQNGRFIKGMGFAPGEQVGTMVLQGFVGPNGSFGMIREGQGIRENDIVSVE